MWSELTQMLDSDSNCSDRKTKQSKSSEIIEESQRRDNWRQTETRFDAQWAAAAPATAQFSWKVRQIEIFDSDINICMS